MVFFGDITAHFEALFGRHAPMVVALLLALLCHALFLYYWQFAIPQFSGDHIITVRLVRKEPPAPVAESAVPAPEVTAAPVTLAEPIPARTTSIERALAAEEVTPRTETALPSGIELYLKALESARQNDSSPQKQFHSFSAADFPSNEAGPDPWAPPQYIQNFVRRAETNTYKGADGLLVRKRVDEFGNVSCSKLIDDPGDAFPPMWHVFPSGTNC